MADDLEELTFEQLVERLEETIAEMAGVFGLDPRELNLELGPLGKLY